jgi:aminoglycoside/choline kinase family phosphotransferase
MNEQDCLPGRDRLDALQRWARAALKQLDGCDPGPLVANPLGGDASFRRYFRTQVEQVSLMLVDAPPERENNPAFVRAAAELRAAGLQTPRILAVNLDHGFMIQEDFGDQLYLPSLQLAQQQGDQLRVEMLYAQAMDALLKLQSDQRPSSLPAYDSTLLDQEMRLFDQWFCEAMLGMTLADDELDLLAATRCHLVESALAQPQVRVHRDYHSRNLMIRRLPDGTHPEDQPPGVIDFQDAVLGAATYVLVSLLRDCYIVWPRGQVRIWVAQYAAKARALGILPAHYSDQQFQRDFDLMGLQRHIKVLGIFCRLALRDGKSRYLSDLPLVMQYVEQVAGEHTELQAFLAWFRNGPALAMRRRLRELGESAT